MLARTPLLLALLLLAPPALLLADDPPAPAPKPKEAPAPKPTPPPPFARREAEAVKKAFPGQDREVLEQCERLELLAIHPYPGTPDGTPARPEDGFQGHKVLGRALITTPEERRTLVEALYRSLTEPFGPPAGCFNPRHALRAVKGERTIDVLLCFECETVHVFSPSFVGEAHPAGHGILRIAKSTEAPFDEALKRHKLVKHVDPVR